MEDRRSILKEFETTFDLERIKKLSVPEKFKLVDFIGLIHNEAHYANKAGLLKLDQSVHYTDNKTYTLYAMLVSNGTKYEMLKKIINNYARNFDDSDVYYAQTLILGIGLMMIDKGFEPACIYNYLMHHLGTEFLMDNQKYSGIVDINKESHLDISREIEYRPFEGNMRQLKYELLALLSYSHEHGIEEVRALINQRYSNHEFRFYFNMLDIDCAELRDSIYEDYEKIDRRTQRLLTNGAYAILQKTDVFTAHYLFNSIIGKYSRYEKDSKEIQQEIKERLSQILENKENK